MMINEPQMDAILTVKQKMYESLQIANFRRNVHVQMLGFFKQPKTRCRTLISLRDIISGMPLHFSPPTCFNPSQVSKRIEEREKKERTRKYQEVCFRSPGAQTLLV